MRLALLFTGAFSLLAATAPPVEHYSLRNTKEFKKSPIVYRETKARIAALSDLPVEGVPNRLKYPELKLVLWKLSASDLMDSVLGSENIE